MSGGATDSKINGGLVAAPPESGGPTKQRMSGSNDHKRGRKGQLYMIMIGNLGEAIVRIEHPGGEIVGTTSIHCRHCHVQTRAVGDGGRDCF